MPVKRAAVSPKGGWGLTAPFITDPPQNTICSITASINRTPTQFLIDTGASVSVIRADTLPEGSSIMPGQSLVDTVGANGQPLEVVGQITISVSFTTTLTISHTFIVVHKLSVPGILGAEFLSKHAAIIDFAARTLQIGLESPVTLPINDLSPLTTPVALINTILPNNTTIPPRTVQHVLIKVTDTIADGEVGLIEPLDNNPQQLILGRSLSVVKNNKAVVQLLNTGPIPITLHKNQKIGTFTPRKYVCVMDQVETQPSPAVGCSIKITSDYLSAEQSCALQALLSKYKHLFAEHEQQLGRTSVIKHAIETQALPIKQPLRRLPIALRDVVKSEVQTMLDKEVIRPSRSAWSSPIVLVQKKDKSWRFCIDFRRVNSVTEKDAYPLPRIDDTLDCLAGAQYFTTLDLASGYWQVEMKESDKEKTAFSTPQGHFEFNVMPFGLTNAPATFQRLMECVLAGLTPEQCLIYLDDVIIFSSSFQAHLEHLSSVLTRLDEAGLKLRLSKCHFAKQEVRYLGHIISRKGVQPDPEKTRAVQDFPPPQSLKQLRSFMGLANYYRRFIRGYAQIATPLHKLTHKNAVFTWSSECQQAFVTLKAALVTAPVLQFPVFDRPFILHTDASNWAVGAVLCQEHEGREHVIAYYSRQLTKAECHYSTTEREALAVITAVKNFYPYLYGRTFTLITDHNPLTTLTKLRDVGGRLSRWILFLQQFDYTMVYKTGSLNTDADALSRVPQGVHSIFHCEEIVSKQGEDGEIRDTIQALQQGKSPPTPYRQQANRLIVQDHILYRKICLKLGDQITYQVVLPHSLRRQVFDELHSKFGHLGTHKTQARIQERVYWPRYMEDIQRWTRSCEECQKRNSPPTAPAPLVPIVASSPFEKVAWDIMGPLPETKRGNKYILVLTDLFTKWVEAFPLKETSAETLAGVLYTEFICRFGLPKYIHSDQGRNLCGKVMQSLCGLLGIQRTNTTAYHPQGNGQTERFNRTLESMIAKMTEENSQDWDLHIPHALYAYRTAIHESTDFSPFSLVFGRSATLPIDLMLGRSPSRTNIPTTHSEFIRSLQHRVQKAFTEVRGRLKVTRRRQKQSHDKHSRLVNYEVGDCVWLYTPVVQSGSTKKFSSLWRGPYTIIDKVSLVTYRIQLVGGSTQVVVHANRLKLCYSDPPVQWSNQSIPRRQDRVPQAGYTRVNTTPTTPAPSATSITTGNVTTGRTHPSRHRQPPDRYGDLIPF